ncbi:hypothetical protein ZYGR_0AY00100 [Zygosaccharomyces rouxii]|uniref:Uncharacterized protein n=1 Tax=Zygosaccharomyces rouxii TaxID=4956 RepID=A0A1Q3AIP5_ZYGRO|nr:hypothetical protein ZYGR_0AY00100 [Zygosaccharomyces rouxii]
MLAGLPFLLSCVSAGMIPVAKRGASKRDDAPSIGPEVSDSIAESVQNTIDIPYFNNTQILNDIENSIESELSNLNQDLENVDPFDFYDVIEQAVEDLPSYLNQFKDDLIQQIEQAISDPHNTEPFKRSKRDAPFPIGSEIINGISDAIDSTVSLPSANKTQILHDIENFVSSRLGDLGQGLEVLDPLNIFQVIKEAVNNLPSDVDPFKNNLIQNIGTAFGALPGIQ